MNRLQFMQKLKETFPRFSAFKLLNEENDQFEISFLGGNHGCTPPSNKAENRSISDLFDKFGIQLAVTRRGSGFMSCSDCRAVIRDNQIPKILSEIEELLNHETISELSAPQGMR
jgi:hypothetical protein